MYTPLRVRVRPFFPGQNAASSSFRTSLDASDDARYACCPSMTTMLTLTTPSESAAVVTPAYTATRSAPERSPFIFVGERLSLDLRNFAHRLRRPRDSRRRVRRRRAHPGRAESRAPLRRSALPTRLLRQHEEWTPPLVRHGDLRQPRQGGAAPGEAQVALRMA